MRQGSSCVLRTGQPQDGVVLLLNTDEEMVSGQTARGASADNSEDVTGMDGRRRCVGTED